MDGSLTTQLFVLVEWVSEAVSFKTRVTTSAINIRFYLVLLSGVFLTVTLLGVRVVESCIYSRSIWNLRPVDECSYLAKKWPYNPTVYKF